jgi:prevent-host-death family protein
VPIWPATLTARVRKIFASRLANISAEQLTGVSWKIIDLTMIKTNIRPEFLIVKPLIVGVYEAKTKLASLLARVARGGEIIITKHDRPVARIVAVTPDDRMPIKDALSVLAQIRARARSGPESLKELIVAGRRV